MRTAVIVVTRNRRGELARCLRTVVSQSASPQLVVVDDGSTDGTADLVRTEFPEATLYAFPESAGPSDRRDFAARNTEAEILVFVDDDAWFASPETVSEIVGNFSDPRIGAVALPASDDHTPLDPAPGAPSVTGGFRGTAVAFRRDAFLAAGGFRSLLVRQGEERDLALRLMESGHLIAAGRLSEPIQHRPSATRDLHSMDFHGRRNDVLVGWLVVPARALPLYLVRMLGHAVVLAVRTRRPRVMAQGFAAGVVACGRHRMHRDPVSPATYRLSRRLAGAAVPIEEAGLRR